MMRFSLQTLLLSFVLIWCSLAAFDMAGIAVAAVLLGIVAYVRAAESKARAFMHVVAAVLILLLFGCCLVAWPVISLIRETGRRAYCTNNIKCVVLALQEYHDVHGSFPPAHIADEDGKPMHSWRVLILPFVEEEVLYQQYDFSEPWNAPNNSKLAASCPDIYVCPSDRAAAGSGCTSYVAVTGPNTLWPGSACPEFGDFGQPMARTIAVVEVANSDINWMEPRDLSYEDAVKGVNAAPGRSMLGGHVVDNGYFFHDDHGAHVALADGSVRFLDQDTPPSTLEALLRVDLEKSVDLGGFRSQLRPHWAHIMALIVLAASFILLLVRPRAQLQARSEPRREPES